MRESNYIFPPQNRAVVSISQMLYDRRALDTSSPLALLNNLTSLTYLTSTSPRIREILTSDGGLERLLDILRESLLPRGYHTPPDLWGLNGPPTARVISVDRGILLKHSLAFQCVVNIGVRGTEPVRTRVVQAGALDLVAQILESWLSEKGIFIFASPFGSKAAVESFIRGDLPPEVVEEAGRQTEARSGPPERERRTRSGSTRHVTVQQYDIPGGYPTGQERITAQIPAPQGGNRSGISQFVANLTRRNEAFDRFLGRTPRQEPGQGEGDGDGDVDMDGDERPASTDNREEADDADVETDGNSTSVEQDDSMDIDQTPDAPVEEQETGPAVTPRASQLILPLSMSIPPPPARSPEPQPQPSFPDGLPPTIARTTSENNLAGPSNAGNRSPMAAPRPANMPIDTMSTQSSPLGSPTRQDAPESAMARRRDTITGRPPNVNLAPPRAERRERDGANSETSDIDVDLQTATINANIRALQAQAAQAQRTGLADQQDGQDADLVLADDADDEDRLVQQEDAFAAEQARLDMEAGAPPGQPGAAQTPRVPLQEPTPRMALLARPPPPDVQPMGPEPAQIIIAAGAPRGFHDLGSYVGISSMLNPQGDCYSEDAILLALQLLAYLSKYPHVRAAFHQPRVPMHPTFDLTMRGPTKLPERPAVSRTPNIFSLVERFTFKAVYGDRTMYKIPNEVQYWAGVIMRNACRKDDAAGGVRQCANMQCGKWERFAREFAKCRRCRKAKYCSKDCQSRAWSEGHRFWCNTRADQEMMEGERRGPRGEEDDDDEMDLPPPPRPTHREADPRREDVLRVVARNNAHARVETAPGPVRAAPPATATRSPTTGRPPGWFTETVQRDGWDFEGRLPDDRQQTLLAQLQRRRDPFDNRAPAAPVHAQPRNRGDIEGQRARNEEALEHQRLNHMLQQTTEAWRAARRENTGRAMAAHAHAQQQAQAHAQMVAQGRDAAVSAAGPSTHRWEGTAHQPAERRNESHVRIDSARSAAPDPPRNSPRYSAAYAQAEAQDQAVDQAHARRDRRTSYFAGLGIGGQQQQQGQGPTGGSAGGGGTGGSRSGGSQIRRQ